MKCRSGGEHGTRVVSYSRPSADCPSADCPSASRVLDPEPCRTRHQCAECEKSFSRPYDLKIHCQTRHSFVPTWRKCAECGVTFTRMHSLNRHYRICHPMEKPSFTSTTTQQRCSSMSLVSTFKTPHHRQLKRLMDSFQFRERENHLEEETSR